jgi:hypothetical protein
MKIGRFCVTVRFSVVGATGLRTVMQRPGNAPCSRNFLSLGHWDIMGHSGTLSRTQGWDGQGHTPKGCPMSNLSRP